MALSTWIPRVVPLTSRLQQFGIDSVPITRKACFPLSSKALVVYAAMGPDNNNSFELSAHIPRQYSRGPVNSWLYRVRSGEASREVLNNENKVKRPSKPSKQIENYQPKYLIRRQRVYLSQLLDEVKHGAGFQFSATRSSVSAPHEPNSRSANSINIIWHYLSAGLTHFTERNSQNRR